MEIVCDICGRRHLADACSIFADHSESEIDQDSLARRTLPRWASYQPLLKRIIVSKNIKKGTKLGPLLAPLSADVICNILFPLKIFVSNEVSLWVDHSDENKCCWLCLIPACGDDHNLYACQMGESLYYVALRDIADGSPLKVWYAPYYKQRIDASLNKKNVHQRKSCSNSLSQLRLTKNDRTDALDKGQKEECARELNISVAPPHEHEIALAGEDVPTRGGSDQLYSSDIHSPTSSYYSNIPPYLSSFATSLQRTIAIQDEILIKDKNHSVALGSLSNDAPQNNEYFIARKTVSKSHLSTVTFAATSSMILNGSSSLGNSSGIPNNDDCTFVSGIGRNSFSTRLSQEFFSLDPVEKISVSKKEIVFTYASGFKNFPLNSYSSSSCIRSPQNSLDCISIKILTKASKVDFDTEYSNHDKGQWQHEETDYECHTCLSNYEDVSIVLASKPMGCLPFLTITIRPLSDSDGKFFHEEIITNESDEIFASEEAPIEEKAPSNNRNHCVFCLHCNSTFFSDVSLASHLKEHLLFLLKRIVFCKNCKVFVDNSISRLRHVPKNSRDKFVGGNHCFHDHSGNSTSRQNRPTRLPPSSALSYLTRNWIGSYSCQICKKGFDKAQYLLRHLAKHLGDFSCHLCKKVFARKVSLLKHNDQVHRNEDNKGNSIEEGFSLTCDKCNIAFSQLNYYKAHCFKHEGPSKCNNCGKFFSSPHSISYHKKHCSRLPLDNRRVARFSQKGKYRCDFCKQNYSLKKSFDEHVIICKQLSTIEQRGEVACLKCGHFCRSAAEFRLHYQSHTHPYSCLICSNKFKSRGLYEVHICSGKFLCDKCQEVFNSIQGLNRHLSIHEPPSFSCNICLHPFYREESLSRHKCKVRVESTNISKKRFQCHKCLSKFSSNYNLKKHLASSHNMVSKQFACSKCGKKFHRSDLLKDHERIHLAPSFSCPECPKEFKSKTALRVHSTLHREDFRFLCRYCNKGFPQKTNLIRHEKSHTPVGAVKCQHCGIRCRSTQHLETHLLSHTNLKSGTPLKKATIVSIEQLLIGRRRETGKRNPPFSLPLAKLAPFHISEVTSPLEAPSGSHIIHEIELTEPPTVFLTELTSLPLPSIGQAASRDHKSEFSYEGSIDLKLVSSE